MTDTRDLFLAILAMDSYNRGYGQGMSGLGVETGKTRLGDATIIRQPDIGVDSPGVSAGFYAIAYDMTGVEGFSAGDTVVSYRGSDKIGSFEGTLWDFIRTRFYGTTDNDVVSGYRILGTVYLLTAVLR